MDSSSSSTCLNCDRLNLLLGEAERERDLAIAHDRQPYPTADAYEKVCEAFNKKRDLLTKATEIGGRFLKAALAGGIRYTDGVGFEFQEFLEKMKDQEGDLSDSGGKGEEK